MAKQKKAKPSINNIFDQDIFCPLSSMSDEAAESDKKKGQTHLPTTPAIDYRTGGGLQEGSILLIRTQPKVGKTTLAVDIAISALKQKRKVIYVDAELRLNETKHLYHPILHSNPDFIRLCSTDECLASGEKLYANILRALKLPEFKGCVVIIDSLSKITPKSTIEDPEVRCDRRDSTPKLNADFCKKVGNLVRISRCILIGIQHLITDTAPNGMGMIKPDGGTKINYDADYVLEAKHSMLGLDGNKYSAPEKNQTNGQMVRWDLPYNKNLTPYVTKDNNEKIKSYLNFTTGGMWWAKEAYDVLQMLGVLSRGGAWFELMTPEVNEKVQGTEKCIALLEKHEEYLREFLKQYYVDTYGINYDFEPYVSEEE